jgi:hypothetical protein
MGTNWEPIPAAERQLLSDLVPIARADDSLFRVDGRLGLGENYGTLVGLQDIRGTSPLRLAALDRYLILPQYRLHQLLAVKYVFTDWQQLEVPSSIRAGTNDGAPPLYLHEIDDPFPRAWMVYRMMVTPDRDQALGWLSDPSFDPRTTTILAANPRLHLPAEAPENSAVTITRYAPEQMELSVQNQEDGVLVISEWNYPGWQAMVDGQRATILEADAGLRALPLAAGEHEIVIRYRPLSVTLGGIASILSLLTIMCVGGAAALRRWRPRPTDES